MSGLLARLRARIPLEEGSLVLITMIWGATFIIIRSALEATGPFFSWACVSLSPPWP